MLPALFPMLLLVAGAAAALGPLRCAPCTEERLALCPPVAAECAELAPEPGCGCCLTCALREGGACGVYTARCGRGLHCQPLPGEAHPLHALIRGQGACAEAGEAEAREAVEPCADEAETREGVEPCAAEAADTKDSLEHENTAPESTEMSPDQLSPSYRLLFPGTLDRLDPWNTISAYEHLKDKRVLERRRWRKQQGLCQKELYKALDKLAKARQRTGDQIYRFYLPNCNRHGFYHSKQCEASLDGERGRCWCVYPLNGKRIPGSPELRGDVDCQQYLAVQQ
ncbi:insulin-like growth factor-binding protein 1 [Rhinatrema bivittatum]|uniref:insulin-like growth factor-binding protein 1 n=1 Tax=Rhinatrema bivittatum TaxID=194408 RepID=UPI00112E4160|nr:insulin-like growth factor-binding protein 1 [Rhinatrema bivittatum]